MNGKQRNSLSFPKGGEGEGRGGSFTPMLQQALFIKNGKPPLPSPLLHPMEERE
jgi:hypothetical protein